MTMDFAGSEKYKEDFEWMMEGIYRTGYSAGRKVACSEISDRLKDTIHQVAHRSGYQEGLDAAWEAVRKLYVDYSADDLKEIFGEAWSLYELLSKYTATEVISMIKDFEDNQKEESLYRDFEIGDIVEYANSTDTFRACVTSIFVTDNGDTYLSLMYEDGSTTITRRGDVPWRKTGKNVNFDWKNVLAQMKNAIEGGDLS